MLGFDSLQTRSSDCLCKTIQEEQKGLMDLVISRSEDKLETNLKHRLLMLSTI